jgi:glyoxylase-like metal-dependent hydrolase (beta-lactamase superfamily II)
VGDLEVITFRRGPFWNFSYLVADRATARAAVIDPAWDAEAILAAAGERGLTIEAALLTHTHTDHVNALAAVVEATGATVFCHEEEASALSKAPDYRLEATSADAGLRIGDLEVRLLHTPGHSPGSLSIFVEGRLFSGDSLLVGGVGRPGPGGVEALWESVRRLRGLPDATVVHPGHDEGHAPVSTIGAEVARVAALRAETFAQFAVALERATGYAHGREI